MKVIKQLLAVIFFLFSTQVMAEAQLGKDFQMLNPAQPTHTGEKIEVLEFFSYGCIHCYHLNPLLSAWEKKIPKDVELQFVPVIFHNSWEPITRAFYALEAMGQQHRLHDDFFTAWNVENVDLGSEQKIADFVAKRGVDSTKFTAAYNSFTMSSKVARSDQMVRDYGIRGTPTLVVDGKYVVTGLTPENTIQVLNEMIVRARKEHGKH